MPSQVGSYIRDARQKAGIGLRELARRIDKSPAYIVALERADVPPGITETTLTAIAKEIGLDVDLLMTLMSKVPASVKPKTPLELELYRLIGQLPVECQQNLLESLKSKPSAQSIEEPTDHEQR